MEVAAQEALTGSKKKNILCIVCFQKQAQQISQLFYPPVRAPGQQQLCTLHVFTRKGLTAVMQNKVASVCLTEISVCFKSPNE